MSVSLGSPFRSAALALSIIVLFSDFELEAATIAIGGISMRVDEILGLWVAALWLVALADHDPATGGVRGFLPAVTACFLAAVAAALVRGISRGADLEFLVSQKTYFGYAAFFPFCWIVSEAGRRRGIVTLLVAAGAAAGLVFFVKAVTGTGEGVYRMTSSGLRVATRQPNAIAVLMLMFTARMWKDSTKPPLLLFLPAVVVMAGAVLLSQTRALWGGVVTALALSWILDLAKREPSAGHAGKALMAVPIALLLAAAVAAVSVTGLLSTGDIGQRVQGEESQLPIDGSLLIRLMSWSEILDETTGQEVLLGNGLGATITYYRLDYSRMWTHAFIDGSFWQAYFNMGLTGAALLAVMVAGTAVSAARLFLRTRDPERSAVALGVFASFVALLVAAQFGSLLTNYSYTALWALLMAVLHREWREERRHAGAASPQDGS